MRIHFGGFPMWSWETRKVSRWNVLFRPSKMCDHGPKVWPWWKWFHINLVKLTVHPPSSGYGLWVYTRGGARCLDIFFDRRTRAQRGL